MAKTINDINAEFLDEISLDFGAGEDLSQQEAAFPSDLAVPQSLPPAPVNLVPAGPNPWPPQLVMDLALNIDLEETVLERHGLNPAGLEKLYTIPQFRREIAFLMRELRDTGVTFSRKAAVQAEDYLSIMDDVMRNTDTPASTRLAIFSKVTTLGKLDPVVEKEDTSNVNQVQVTINL